MLYDLKLFSDHPLNGGLSAPIEAHLAWAAKHIYSKPYALSPQAVDGIARTIHGAQHAARVAFYVVIFANLYRKYGDRAALELTNRQLKLLEIAAIFHDSGREADGPDEWDIDSASNLYAYLSINLGINPDEAKDLAESIANKDYHPSKIYYSFKVSATGIYEWKRNHQRHEKSIFAKLIGAADCLDIIRARIVFDANHLDFYQDIVLGLQKEAALDDMALIITEARSLIDAQGDNIRKRCSDIKKKYEHEAEHLYPLLMDEIKTACIPGTDRLLRPTLAALLGEGALISETALLRHNPPFSSEDPILRSLENGRLFSRGIRTPAAVLYKSPKKMADIQRKDSRFEETLSHCEIRKLLRTPDILSASGRLGKLGNKNRSCTLLGWGANTYAPAGLLIHNDDRSNIVCIVAADVATGSGKKKNILTEPAELIESKLKSKIHLNKMGGSAIQTGINYFATHNEIVLNLHQNLVVGVYFTQDTNMIAARVARTDGYPLHRHASVLEAIHIQKEYQIQTGKLLPIYEYSGTHNFLQIREYTDASIVILWQELIEDYLLRAHFMDPAIFEHDEFLGIEKIKILAMYTANNPYPDQLKPVDSNYTENLRDHTHQAIARILKKI